ncbi:MAG: integrase [Clostridia bacterium]|nr:integrase [Clostridia bacterium]
MDQQWNQPGYRPGNNYYTPGNQGGGYQRPYAPPNPPPQMTQPTRLSREEQMEAKRLAEQAKFSFDGYQVVRREFISHNFDPAMTIRGNSITFNNACISKLEDATYVQFLINPTEQRLLIRPCDEGARDAVRWCIVREDKRKSRQITCAIFIEKLREMMGWDDLYRYRLQGMRITYEGEPLYLFDLSSNECFLPQSRDPETGKLRRPKAILPSEWAETFGMEVKEHTASTQVDLSKGYVTADVNPQEELPLITAQIE